MKAIFASIVVMIFILTACSSSKNTMVAATEQQITNAVDSNRWVFKANMLMPQTGGSKYVNGSDYAVKYTNNKLNVYLPYYGTAYSGADVLSTTGPLDFTTANITVNKELVKAGEWEIKIKPINNSEVQVMNFTFFNNGTANLNIVMSNRSPISFTGTVQPAK